MIRTLLLFMLLSYLPTVYGQTDSTKKSNPFERIFGACAPRDSFSMSLTNGHTIIYSRADTVVRCVKDNGKIKWETSLKGTGNNLAGIIRQDVLRLDRFVLKPYDLQLWPCQSRNYILLDSKRGRVLVLSGVELDDFIKKRVNRQDVKILQAKKEDRKIRNKQDYQEWKRLTR
ncbi:hypothetical protein KFE98_03340 [bacterium SCSIO 12741]|nr:hypothetical protein KFE98_03340 [bacterium SCSIO 12741]